MNYRGGSSQNPVNIFRSNYATADVCSPLENTLLTLQRLRSFARDDTPK